MILTDAVIVVGDIDVSGDSNQIQMNFSRADLDRTTFGAGGKIHRAGMLDFVAEAAGFWTPDTTDEITPLDTPTTRDLTVAFDSAPGSPAFISQAVILAGSWGGPIDTLSQWSAQLASRGVKRGQVGLYGQFAAPAASPGAELGALDTGESITATIHTLTLDDDADIELQSSATNGWSSPDTEDSDTVTATGVTRLTATGTVTNTWWRVAIAAVSGPSAFLITLHRS